MTTSARANQKLGKPRTIGQLANEAGVNVETVRFYERRGLLRQPRKPASGWRAYEESAVWVIHYIKAGRRLGFTLSELKKLLANTRAKAAFCASVQNAYQDKLRQLDKKIQQLRAMRLELKNAHAACVKRSAMGECPIAQRCSAQSPEPIQITTMRRNK